MASPDFDVTSLTKDKPKKKRGRPTKAESEARRALLRAKEVKTNPTTQPISQPNISLSSGETRYVTQKYLLRPGDADGEGIWIEFTFPTDTTKAEAERMAAFVSSCYFTE